MVSNETQPAMLAYCHVSLEIALQYAISSKLNLDVSPEIRLYVELCSACKTYRSSVKGIVSFVGEALSCASFSS